jgi:predicted alpha-1,2-mannosidase
MTMENDISICPYVYTDEIFYGMLATHQPAQWMGESAEIAVCPGVGEVKTAFADRGLYFSHDNEVSSPHYYKTSLQATAESEAEIIAEITASSRASAMRFTFNSTSPGFVTLQATRKKVKGEIEVDVDNQEIRGYNPERQDFKLGPFAAEDFKGYFVAKFDVPFKTWGVALGANLQHGTREGTGKELSAFVTFGDDVEIVNIRVGMSFISIDQARINLQNEISDGTTLEDAATGVEKEWAEKLDRVQITNATLNEKVIFYTAMYHALQYPSEMMETNSSGSYYYSGYDNQVHAGEHAYTGYSIWDTYRAEWAFLNLFAPERINGMITSMLQTYQQGGRLPIWQNIVETNVMIGTHSSSLIAESLAKGFNGFDLELAWEALWKDAMVPPEDDLTTMYFDRQPGTACEARAGLTRENKLGYVAAQLTSEAGSRTLEYAYDDYTVAVAAELTNHHDKAKFFYDRSKNYRNIFNNDTNFMEARYEDGSWCPHRNTWTEATNWIYTFNTQHDFGGLRDLFHGAAGLEKKLDEYYEGGHNDQTNEPSHATAYAYYYANEPAKAQSTVRSLLLDNYWNSPVGISGNDDCGQMSSWYIFNALGFYPMNPASAEYVVSSPIFDKVEIRLPQVDHVLTLIASESRNKQYVGGVSMDGEEVISPVLKHAEVLKASSITFAMSDKPQTWGSDVL